MLGFLAGMIQGLFFHKEDWLGGYKSWPRRLMRLGHVAFFGMAFANLCLVVSLQHLNFELDQLLSFAFLIASYSMPLICYISAFYKPARHFFPIPVISLIMANSIILWRILPA